MKEEIVEKLTELLQPFAEQQKKYEHCILRVDNTYFTRWRKYRKYSFKLEKIFYFLQEHLGIPSGEDVIAFFPPIEKIQEVTKGASRIDKKALTNLFSSQFFVSMFAEKRFALTDRLTLDGRPLFEFCLESLDFKETNPYTKRLCFSRYTYRDFLSQVSSSLYPEKGYYDFKIQFQEKYEYKLKKSLKFFKENMYMSMLYDEFWSDEEWQRKVGVQKIDCEKMSIELQNCFRHFVLVGALDELQLGLVFLAAFSEVCSNFCLNAFVSLSFEEELTNFKKWVEWKLEPLKVSVRPKTEKGCQLTMLIA